MILRTAPADATPQPVAWADAACPLCGHRDEEIILEAADPNPPAGPGLRFAVVRCRRCELAYTNPRPDESSIGRFYPTDYRPHRRPRLVRDAGKLSWWGRLTGRSSRERDGGLHWVGEGRLLDFGCGGGGYLKRMAAHGWHVTGLDSATAAVQSVQEELGLPALVGTLPHPELTPGSFDVVTMWHSLEHVHRPLVILREAFRLLAPGGRLVVACPNRAGWAASAFGPSWFGLDLPRHLTHFTPDTLATTLAAAGFKLSEMRQLRRARWVWTSAQIAARRPDAPARQRALAWKPLAKAAAALAYWFGRGDCLLAVAERPG